MRAIPPPAEAVLRDLYEIQKLTSRQIAARLGVSKPTVLRWLRTLGIETRPVMYRGINPPGRDELERLIHVERKTYREIAGIYGADRTAVSHWIRKHGIRPLSLSVAHRKDRHTDLPDKAELERLYGTGLSLGQIGDMYGVAERSIQTAFKQLGIAIRESGFNQARIVCADGDIVRSVYEQRVDDWLSAHSVPHVYEPSLPFSTKLKADFQANGWYIEIWGVQGWDAYEAKKARKQHLYQVHGLPLIEIEVHHLNRQRKTLDRRLSACLNPPVVQNMLFD